MIVRGPATRVDPNASTNTAEFLQRLSSDIDRIFPQGVSAVVQSVPLVCIASNLTVENMLNPIDGVPYSYPLNLEFCKHLVGEDMIFFWINVLQS